MDHLTHPVLSARVVHGLFDELPGDPPRRPLVEDGVHEGDSGGAAAGLGFRRAGLQDESRETLTYKVISVKEESFRITHPVTCET